jgi:hypothetical protein
LPTFKSREISHKKLNFWLLWEKQKDLDSHSDYLFFFTVTYLAQAPFQPHGLGREGDKKQKF